MNCTNTFELALNSTKTEPSDPYNVGNPHSPLPTEPRPPTAQPSCGLSPMSTSPASIAARTSSARVLNPSFSSIRAR